MSEGWGGRDSFINFGPFGSSAVVPAGGGARETSLGLELATAASVHQSAYSLLLSRWRPDLIWPTRGKALAKAKATAQVKGIYCPLTNTAIPMAVKEMAKAISPFPKVKEKAN